MIYRSPPADTVEFGVMLQDRCVRLLRLVGLLGVLGCWPSMNSHADDQNPTFEQTVAPFLNRYCVDCHGAKRQKGGVALHELKGALTAGPGAAHWDRVLTMLERGTMPPEGVEQPSATERQAVSTWVRAALRAEAKRPAVAHTDLRRLTNVEYQNTLRDLFGLDLKVIDDLPKDPFKPYRFANTAELLRFGPEQLDAYRAIARRVLASAIVDPDQPKPMKIRREWKATEKLDPAAVADGRLEPNQVGVWPGGRFNVSQGMDIVAPPTTGAFCIRIQATGLFPPGTTEMPLRLVMGEACNRFNSSTKRIEVVGTIRLKANVKTAIYELRGRLENFPRETNRNQKGKALPDALIITPQNLYDDGTLNDENGFRKPRMRDFPIAVIDWMEFETPSSEAWPPLHHQRILFDSPLRATAPDKYIREVLQRFMTRAFRRPVTTDEVDRFAKIYDLLKPELKTIEATLRETLSLVLVAPQFLLHHEAVHPSSLPAATRQYAFASRLSYFLWASMPDDELLTRAANGELDRPAIIEQQVCRLLDDPRAHDFVREFARQWLALDKMHTVPVNRELFPRFLYYVPLGERAGTEEPYRPTIRDHMAQETLAFVGHLLRHNEKVEQLIDSSFTYLNQPLAAHYGVPGVVGDELQCVPLKPEYHLGGLLTHGSMLIGNGTGSAPHPIYRAVWLREAILGEDVPPPPADVPALVETAGVSAEKASTIKEHLVRHRQQASCNACHARLDPWGIPFEEYNAVGKFQPKIPKEGTRVSPFKATVHKDLAGYGDYLKALNTVAVDARTRLPDGPTVNGVAELKAYLIKERRDDLARNVLRRFYAYSLGRELTWRDRFAVEEMLKDSAKNSHRLRTMLVTICQSDAFRKMTPTKDNK